MQHIIRLQLALMKPGVSDIKIHVDSGGYAIRGHRLHIPVFTHPEVSFDVCPHRYLPDPEHKPGPGEEQRMLDIQVIWITCNAVSTSIQYFALLRVSALQHISLCCRCPLFEPY